MAVIGRCGSRKSANRLSAGRRDAFIHLAVPPIWGRGRRNKLSTCSRKRGTGTIAARLKHNAWALRIANRVAMRSSLSFIRQRAQPCVRIERRRVPAEQVCLHLGTWAGLQTDFVLWEGQLDG